MSLQIIPGGITAPQGWQAAALAAGIKPSGKIDLTLLYSPFPAVGAGVFTTNVVRAPSVDYDEQLIGLRQAFRAVVINAGCANAATGEVGVQAVQATAQCFADALSIQPSEILIASTGVIGVQLPMAKIEAAAPTLVQNLSIEGGNLAAQAILTTDLVEKTIALETEIEGYPVRVGAMGKGSGMIHPNMATLLAFITSDCAVAPSVWQALLSRANAKSFNQITVDGDTSTNDLLLALSNGQAGNPLITELDSPAAEQLGAMIDHVCIDLAKKVARDGEGATKLLEIQVTGAPTVEAARLVARTVAGSNLFKCAVFGNDPNWGRIAAAAGRAGVPFRSSDLGIWLGVLQLMAAGQPLSFDRAQATQYLKQEPVVVVRLDLGAGTETGTAWGCDLTYEYVRINGEYTT